MTHHAPTQRRSQPSPRRSAASLLVAPAIGALVGLAVIAAASAHADPSKTPRTQSPSYQLGYSKTVKDVQLIASRMRAEGFQLGDIDIYSRTPSVFAKESASVRTFPGLNEPEVLQGSDGMKTVTSPTAGSRRRLFTPLRCEGPVRPGGCCVRRVRLPERDESSAGIRMPLV
jgi:hypothetical protein